MTDQYSDDFSYIKAAAELRLRLEPWKIDQKFKSQGGKIFYAVDTDIVKMFSDPSKMSKYSTVFPGDDKRTREILTWALGRFIFSQLTDDNQPLLIIPPHHQELENVFMSIARDALKEKEEIDLSLTIMNKYVEQYRQDNNLDSLISKLKEGSLDLLLFAFGGGKGAIAELSRITDLLRDDCILHVERYAEDRAEGKWVLPMPPDDDILKNLAKYWSERLSETKSKLRPRPLLLDDAMVMARLGWMNNEMAEDKVRVVLVTGDPALQRAAKYHVDDEHTFADLYIRDPRVFMASSDFLRIKNTRKDIKDEKTERKDDLIGWLDVFLARYYTDNSDYPKNLKEIEQLKDKDRKELVQEFIEKAPNCMVNLKRDWKECVELTAIKYSFSSEEEQVKSFLKVLEEKGLAQIKEKIELMTSKVWLDFWKFASIAGLGSTGMFEVNKNIKGKLHLRGVPALRLTVEPFKTMARELCCTLRHQDIISPDQKFLFDNMLKIEQSGYSAFLIHALAFGAKGRWNVCSILSRYALNIADDNEKKSKFPKDHEPITGNEACYLLARAIRHTIKTSEKLSTVKKYMEEAKTRKVRATGEEFDFRYESEFIGIDMTYHFFRIFIEEEIPEGIPDLSQCQSKIIGLLENPQIDKGEEYICITVKKQLLVYLFYALLLRQCKDNEPGIEEEAKKVAEKWLPVFDSILGLDSEVCRTITCFTHPVYLAAKHYYKYVPQVKDCSKIPEDITIDNIKDYYVMYYDERVYDLFIDIIKDHIKSPY
ncbi:MAG: hypothetical protein HQL05_03395 [Nitrospirae bacterium]|uniref:hypothetical protein n=1 Tax=Candidatus Magnetobacterium casense TaxID=1455061 RepID=UPI00058DE7B8|nr:hypothetical protein [Candidatus Magnetobacterium casensis]MBF0336853.1 hypothetical protein [Nitrospirota bacterium]